jgi:hypothetical protein
MIASEGYCELARATQKVGYRRRVPARTSREPNATVIERPGDRFERVAPVLRTASMTGRRPDANWSAATIWICRPHTPAAAMLRALPEHWNETGRVSPSRYRAGGAACPVVSSSSRAGMLMAGALDRFATTDVRSERDALIVENARPITASANTPTIVQLEKPTSS